jgi:predicted acetyltransferase
MVEISLRELSMGDGTAVYEMLQEIGPGENGFQNDAYGISPADFLEFLRRNVDLANGVGVPSHLVPRTIYWLFADGRPVGFAKLRHHLNDYLRKNGHIGFSIRPSERGKGYGNVLLRQVLGKAKELGLGNVTLTCREGNLVSRKIIESNGGLLTDVHDGDCHYSVRI